ncbi:MAG TPA: arginine--tRNA ligase [Alphaproteobacteria bacterium]|nr:arginine--tRNA ligase [Alphaproteobacteria bacterium]
MPSLAECLTKTVASVFEAAGFDPAFGVVRISDRPDLAAFQCNGALAAAKALKRPPREVAQQVADRLKVDSLFSNVELAGPGFINLDVTDAAVADHLAGIAGDTQLGVPDSGAGETVVLDYGGPNVAKPMHVGHLRSGIIGESLRRIYGFAGFRTVGDVHMGDWGLQMGQVISECALRYPEWPYFDGTGSGPYPKDPPFTFAALEEIYPAASKACKADPERMEQARKATVELQSGRPGYRALWRHIVDVSVEGMKKNYEDLNVFFDLWKGEADVHDRIVPMVASLRAGGWAQESEGALVIPVARNDDRKEMPPLILYKTDGAVMYGTTDLATVAERVELYAPSRIVYVVDQRQSLHFEQLFRAAHLSRIAPESLVLTHAGFGTMNGTDGKPFKTREGGIMKLEDLIAMGLEKARARIAEAEIGKDFSDAEREDIARKVAVAAIKFADLHNNRSADYVFDLDRMTRFEGKTGPYLLYQAVRIKSLLRKAAERGFVPSDAFTLKDPDRALAFVLCDFPDAFAAALRNDAPHHLCDYAWRLAQQFSSFYAACPILPEPDEALRASRLALSALTCRTLETTLDLLGLRVPERM